MANPQNGHKMVLTGAVQGDIALYQHLVVVVAVFKQGHLGLIQGVQPLEGFMHVHFGHARRGVFQRVVGEVETQNLHDVSELFGDKLHLFRIGKHIGKCRLCCFDCRDTYAITKAIFMGFNRCIRHSYEGFHTRLL